MRRSHSELARANEGRFAGGSTSVVSVSELSAEKEGGLNGEICSGVSAGVVRSFEFIAPAALVLRRVPQFWHVVAPCAFMVPQIGQRTSVEGASSAAQFLQNLLVGLLGVPQCGQ